MTGNHLGGRCRPRPGPPSNAKGGAAAFYEHWLSRRAGAMVPDHKAIDLAALSHLLPRIQVLDRRADGSFEWRRIGAELVAFFGRDRSGQTFDPAALPRHDRDFLAVYTAVGSQPCGAVVHCRAQTTSERVAGLKILALPLLDDAGCANRVLAYSEVFGLGRRELQRFGCFIDLRIERLDFSDIGAGKPPKRDPAGRP